MRVPGAGSRAGTMKACIYARTCREERQHQTTSLPNQIAFCRSLAAEHNLGVEEEHIFTDAEKRGDLPPTCWAPEGADSRPALSALVSALENGEVTHVIVRRLEKLGTGSEVLGLLLDLLTRCDARVVTAPEALAPDQDERARFALSILRPRVQAESAYDIERRARRRQAKAEEAQRMRARLARLEAEIAELDGA
jgi:DNA invertase Pin-like site-specific DNA recombinase